MLPRERLPKFRDPLDISTWSAYIYISNLKKRFPITFRKGHEMTALQSFEFWAEKAGQAFLNKSFFTGALLLCLLAPGCSPPGPDAERTEYMNIQQAAFQGDTGAVERFLDEGVPVEEDLASMGSALHNAVAGGHAETVGFLIERGADVNLRQERTISDATPLHIAANYGYSEIVELLIRHGADVNAPKSAGGITGITPLHDAVLTGRAHEGHLKSAELLIENGADVNARAESVDESMTPLRAARQLGYEDIAELIARYGGKK